jgi:AcrR family transcriptional regulator
MVIYVQSTSRRERNKVRTRAQLREVALTLFRDRGYESTCVQEIADAADTAKATFFNYYPTKEHVLAEFHADGVASFLQNYEKRRPDSAADMLLHLTRAAMRWAESEPELTAAIVRNLWGSAVLAAEDRVIGERFGSVIKEILRKGMADEEFDDGLNVDVASSLVMSTLNGCVLDWVMTERSFKLDRAATRRMTLLMKAFTR